MFKVKKQAYEQRVLRDVEGGVMGVGVLVGSECGSRSQTPSTKACAHKTRPHLHIFPNRAQLIVGQYEQDVHQCIRDPVKQEFGDDFFVVGRFGRGACSQVSDLQTIRVAFHAHATGPGRHVKTLQLREMVDRGWILREEVVGAIQDLEFLELSERIGKARQRIATHGKAQQLFEASEPVWQGGEPVV